MDDFDEADFGPIGAGVQEAGIRPDEVLPPWLDAGSFMKPKYINQSTLETVSSLPVRISIGDLVKLVGLKTDALNGRIGRADAFYAASTRFAVHFMKHNLSDLSSDRKLLKSVNLLWHEPRYRLAETWLKAPRSLCELFIGKKVSRPPHHGSITALFYSGEDIDGCDHVMCTVKYSNGDYVWLPLHEALNTR